jgi:Ohr subfamily peroxiredoxin
MRDRGTIPGQPALRGVTLAVLLLRPVLWGDEFGRQRQDVFVSGCDDAGAEEGVEVFRAAIGTLACRAARTMELARAEMLGPIQRNQYSPIQKLEWREHPLYLDRFEEQRGERRRCGAIEHQAGVAGYSACFGGSVEYAAFLEKVKTGKITVTADVTLHVSDATGYGLAVHLKTHVDGVDRSIAERLVANAHNEICTYSKATRNNIEVTIEVV